MNVAVAFALVTATTVQAQAQAGSPIRVFEGDADPVAQDRIDELVLGRLKQLGITPARVCSDGVFVRRAYLDVIGILPTAEEAAQFLKDSDPDKRRKLVDRLLEREEFADYWAMKWCDLLRVLRGSDPKRPENVVEIYLTILSRMPTEEELQIAGTHVKETWTDRGPRDLFWALINSPEFCFRH